MLSIQSRIINLIYISNDDILESNNIFYSNIEKNNKHIYSLSSRTMAIIKRNANLYSCYHELYNFIKNINGNLFYEKDICKNIYQIMNFMVFQLKNQKIHYQ